jgi:hypothetical protein
MRYILVADALFPGSGCEALDIIEKPISTNPKVVGAIGRKEFHYFWKNILKAPKDVMQIIEHGYKIPFKSFPPPKSMLGNNKSAMNEPEFVCDSLSAYERLGCIKKVDYVPHIVMPLSVVWQIS